MELDAIIEAIGVEPYRREKAGVIYCADCLDILLRIPPGSIDLLITDPPFNLKKNYGKGANDDLPPETFWEWYKERFMAMSGVLRDRGLFYISSTTPQIFNIREYGEAAGLRWLQILIWYGPNMIGGTKAFRAPWAQLYEPITLFCRGKRPRMKCNREWKTNTHDVIIEARPQSNYKAGRFHVCQKPLNLYLKIISRSPGDVVLDCFAGSGTTGVAAKQLGRPFILIEISEKYCAIAVKRLAQGELF